MKRWLFTMQMARKELDRERALRRAAEEALVIAEEHLEFLQESFDVVIATRDEYARRLEGCHRINQDLISGQIRAFPS